MRDSFTILAAFGLLAASVWDARAEPVTGRVVGGGERYGLTVRALASRHLGDIQLGAAPVGTRSGRFELSLAAPDPVFLVVTAGCDGHPVDLASCQRFLPLHQRVAPGEAPVTLQVPDLQALADVESGTRAPPGPLRPIGLAVIAVALLLAGWLWRRESPPADGLPDPPDGGGAPIWPFVVLGALLMLWRLGSEGLDLLEYSYFHEGVRPASASAVVADAISAQLAHGPIMPLILRAAEALSPSPWVLRAPSVLFTLGFIATVGWIGRQSLDRPAAAAITLIAAVAPVAVFYGRDASPYALAGSCAALAIAFALRGGWTWFLFPLVHVVGIFSHYGFVFFSLAQAFALTLVWWRPAPRKLAYALLAFSVAAILPVLAAPHLEHMLVASGVRFSLMSPVYPESPGLFSFAGTMLTVLFGLPAWATLGLVVVVGLWAIGIGALWTRSRTLAAMVIAQAVFILVWLAFSHHMSTDVGGGRVFYAFRWSRPLLLGLWIPLGVAATTGARPLVAIVALVMLVQSGAMAIGGARPAQAAAAEHIARHASPDDRWAVLPAAFYGDPALYALADGRPPSLVTRMQQWSIPVGSSGASLIGPLVELDLTLETRADRLAYDRLWVLAYREQMFGVDKFDARATARTIAWLDAHQTRLDHVALPYLDLYLYGCDRRCQWRGAPTLTIRLGDRLDLLRYRTAIVPPALPGPDDTVDLVLPAGTRTVVASSPVGLTSPARVAGSSSSITVNGPGRIALRVQRTDRSLSDITLGVSP